MSVEKYLKERLLIDENQNVNTKFDELASTVKMLVKEKCREQKMNCVEKWHDFNDKSSVYEAIINAKEPEL